MVWTVERSADEDRHTAVLGGKEVRGSTAMAQVCATSPLHSAHSSLLSLHRRPGPYVNTRLQSALRRNLPPRECRSHPALAENGHAALVECGTGMGKEKDGRNLGS